MVKDSEQPTLLATTAPAYLDVSGRVCIGSRPSPASTLRHDPGIISAPEQGNATFHGTSSLVDVAFRTLAASASSGTMSALLASDTLPPHLVGLLQRAKEVEEAGGMQCSVCGKAYVVPRTEWVEWWSWRRLGGMVPFLREGCGWGCVRGKEGDGDAGVVSRGWGECGWMELNGEGVGCDGGLILRGVEGDGSVYMLDLDVG